MITSFYLGWIIVALGTSVSKAVHIPAEVPRPPTIIEQTEGITYALQKLEVRLKCLADALPNVKESKGYYWKKDGEVITNITQEDDLTNNSSIVMSKYNGTIWIRGSANFTTENLLPYEGKYQCFASNERGTAMSRFIYLKVAKKVSYIVPADKTIKVTEGESKKIACRQNNAEDIETWWNFLPDTVKLSNRIAKAPDGTIVFSNIVAQEDNGLKFYCTLKHLPTRTSRDGPHYTLSVKPDEFPPDFEPTIILPKYDDEQRVVLLGEELKLACIAIGRPTPSVLWTKTDDVLAGDRYEMRDFNRTLYIPTVTYDDAGTYTCTVSNHFENRKRDISVIVEAKPYFPDNDKQPTNTIKVPGDEVTITCAPEGTPTPTVEWFINGEPIEETTDDPRRDVYSDSIVVRNLTDQDTVVYQCLGRNKHGIVMGQAFVNVVVSKPFEVTGNSYFYRKMEGDSVEMQCKMFASPAAVYTWTKNEITDGDLTDDNRFKKKKNNALKITKINLQDSGRYTCEASNEHGEDSVEMTLLVLKKTMVRPAVEQVRVTNGKDVVMEVKLDVDANLTVKSVKWFKDGSVMYDGEEMELLSVTMSDAGVYKVTVKTDMDSATTSVELIVQDVPSPPRNAIFTANPSDAYVGTLTWEPPVTDNNSPIEDYKVEYEADELYPDRWVPLIDSVEGDVTTVEVQYLESCLSYSFRVWAKNGIGWSVSSSNKTASYKTPPSIPRINPTGVRGKGNAPDNMVITWNQVEPLKYSGQGFGYEVSWCLESNCTWFEVFVSNDTTSYVVTNTNPYTRYLINVTSANNLGSTDGVESVIGYSGEDVPQSSPNLTDSDISDDGTVTISWDPPPEDDTRGLVTGYRVRVTEKETGKYEDRSAGPNEVRFYLNDLTPNTEYQISIAVKNSAGESNLSAPTYVKTPEGFSGPPDNLTAVRRTVDTITIAWQEPKEKNGIISSYRVKYITTVENSTLENTTEIQHNTTASSIVKLEDLLVGVSYNVTVCAATGRGYSDDCATLTISTRQPEAPGENQYKIYVDDNLANITWRTLEEEEENGIPTEYYYIEHKKARDVNEEWIRSEKISTRAGVKHLYNVGELEPGTQYEIRLIATNDIGTTKSKSKIFRTSGVSKQQATAGIIGQAWFIAILCIIPLLLLLLIAICLVQRRKGGKYSVSEKEEQLVKLESQPMNNDDKGKYSVNPNDDTVKENANNISEAHINNPLQSRRTRGDSVGGNSIEVFGSGDTRDFEEDGSFIDQYGVDRRSNSKSEGVESPASDGTKDVSEVQKKLLDESGN